MSQAVVRMGLSAFETQLVGGRIAVLLTVRLDAESITLDFGVGSLEVALIDSRVRLVRRDFAAATTTIETLCDFADGGGS